MYVIAHIIYNHPLEDCGLFQAAIPVYAEGTEEDHEQSQFG